MIDSADWKEWLHLGPRCLWINGIAGAGKTVLLAYLIEQVRKTCKAKSDEKTTYVYYYCYHGHDRDETDHLFRWIISQLGRARQDLPKAILEIFRDRQQPRIQDLAACLGCLLEQFETVYLLIDALDESKSVENLLTSLKQLLSEHRFQKLQILATSRQHLNIGDVMKDIAVPISMSNPMVERSKLFYNYRNSDIVDKENLQDVQDISLPCCRR